MNLTIDVGNTRIKLAVFAETALLVAMVCPKDQFSTQLEKIAAKYPEITHCILARVGGFSEKDRYLLKKQYELLVLTNSTVLPFKNNYGTPQTLGVDRIALAAAAVKVYPGQDVLVIDAGSCITYDFVNEDGSYLGGSISPGINMRYKAVHTFTEKLPLLVPTLPLVTIGKSTDQSIHSGILQGIVFEIEGFSAMYRKKYPNLTVILTGGDAEFLRDSLKSHIFAHSNFLLEGLNYILEHNKH
jgi:type III pantothenate kinase